MKRSLKMLTAFLAVMLCATTFTGCYLKDPTDGLTDSSGLEFTLASEIEGLTYEGDYVIEGEDYYVCTGIGTCTDTDIVVPAEYNGKAVKAIGGFFGNANIKSVVLPNSIEVIRSLAFGRCTGMTSFNMGNGVVVIEHCAFGTCSSLTPDGLVFSKKAEFIGWECFHHAEALTALNLPKSLKTIDYNIMNGVAFETVNYAGSSTEWAEVNLNENNAELLDATYNYKVKIG